MIRLRRPFDVIGKLVPLPFQIEIDVADFGSGGTACENICGRGHLARFVHALNPLYTQKIRKGEIARHGLPLPGERGPHYRMGKARERLESVSPCGDLISLRDSTWEARQRPFALPRRGGALQIRNHLLCSLTEADMAALQPHLEAVELPIGYILEVPNASMSHAYFLDGGIGSVVTGDEERAVETGIVGRDGMTGTAIALLAAQCPSKTFMQIAGKGRRIEAGALLAQLQKSRSMHRCFLRYAFAFNVQTANTVLSNAKANLEARLARWLLMVNDRLDGDGIIITQELLSMSLAVRRTGITRTIASLVDRGCIAIKRGSISIRDRASLKEVAASFYGAPEREQLRLTGWKRKR